MAKRKVMTAEERDRPRRMRRHVRPLGALLPVGAARVNRERIPVKQYETLADTWKPKPRPAREWTRLARKAGMKYMVMTAAR